MSDVKNRVVERVGAGDLEGARKVLADAVDREPGRADYRFLYFQVCDRLGRADEAQRSLEAAYRIDPTDPTVLRELERLRSRPSGTSATPPAAPAPRPGPSKVLNDIALPETDEELRDYARRNLDKEVVRRRNSYRAEWLGMPLPVKVFAVALFAFVLGLPVWFDVVEPRLPVSVPDVRGLSKLDASFKLSEENIHVTATREVTAVDLPIGMVAGTDPAAGSRVNRSTDVVILVAGAQVKVPNVKGLSWARALKRLGEASINAETGDETQGKVVRTEPPAGTLVRPRGPGEPGTPVLIVMSGP